MNLPIGLTLWLIFSMHIIGCFSQSNKQDPVDITEKTLSLAEVDCQVESLENEAICQSKSVVEAVVLTPPVVLSRPVIIDLANPAQGSQGGSSIIRMGNPDTNDDDDNGGFDCNTLVCDDENFCTTDSCTSVSGCQFAAIPNGPSTLSCTVINPMTSEPYPPVCAAGFRLCDDGLPTESDQAPPEADLNYCQPAILPGQNFEICDNNIDDDCDGLTDEEDSAVSSPPVTDPSGCLIISM